MLLAILTACHADDPAAPPLLGSLAITPEAAIVVGGGVLALTATGVDGSGNPMPADVSWTVSDTTVATVAQDGSPNLWATSACGVTTVGDGLCWGLGGSGQLGVGDPAARLVPAPVTGGHVFSVIPAPNRRADSRRTVARSAGASACTATSRWRRSRSWTRCASPTSRPPADSPAP